MTEKCAKSQGAPAFESRLQPVAVRQVAAIGAKRPLISRRHWQALARRDRRPARIVEALLDARDQPEMAN